MKSIQKPFKRHFDGLSGDEVGKIVMIKTVSDISFQNIYGQFRHTIRAFLSFLLNPFFIGKGKVLRFQFFRDKFLDIPYLARP